MSELKSTKFMCCCTCDKDECARFHNPPQPSCHCIRQLSKSKEFIEKLLDCADTVVRVLSICGIHPCKAKAAAQVIIFAFLHYDIVPDPLNDALIRKLRKEDVFHDLGHICRMNRIETHVAYCIIKRAFKAFYYKQLPDRYNVEFVDESQWMQAAQKSAETYAYAEGFTEVERKKYENQIKGVYCGYIERVHESRRKESSTCKCCFCTKCQPFGARGFKVYSSLLPKEDEAKFKFHKKLLEEGKKAACAPPDPCGLRLLEQQTLMKTGRTKECRCGGEKCFCAHAPDCGDITSAYPLKEGIAVDWACIQSDERPPEKECLEPQ